MDIRVVYVILTGSKKEQKDAISGEAYADIEDAVKFIERRADKPVNVAGWRWESETHYYKIKELSVAGV